MRTLFRRSRVSMRLAAVALAAVVLPAAADSSATEGCPMFHCDAAASGVMLQPIVQTPTRITKNNTLGKMKAQGCAGDGDRLACLFVTDDVTAAPGKGTLKVLDGRDLQPVWGSADTATSRELDGPSAGSGQVPYMFANGRIAAGDKSVHALYEADGTLVATVPLTGKGNNLGLTPIGIGLGVVSQTDGTLTLVDLMNWTVLSTLKLRDPVTEAALGLVSPSSAAGNSLYAVARNGQTNRGFLVVIQLEQNPSRLTLRTQYEFIGRTGASAVVIRPDQSGLAGNLVLLHSPQMLTDPTPVNRLVGLLDTGGTTLTTAWALTLIAPLKVSPTFDATTQTLYYNYGPDGKLYRANYVTGAPLRSFNIRGLMGLGGFSLNGHLVASNSSEGFIVLLSGSLLSGADTAGQYFMAFKPSTKSFVWTGRTHTLADNYTGAWTLVPSAEPGRGCPVVVGLNTGLTRMCDF